MKALTTLLLLLFLPLLQITTAQSQQSQIAQLSADTQQIINDLKAQIGNNLDSASGVIASLRRQNSALQRELSRLRAQPPRVVRDTIVIIYRDTCYRPAVAADTTPAPHQKKETIFDKIFKKKSVTEETNKTN